MMEKLREMEVARQEMKLKVMQVAFEKAQAAKHNCDYEQLKTNLDKQEADVGSRYLIGFSADWAVWQEAWQAAQEQMLKNLYTRKMVCAIENRVQDQMDASGVQEPLHRLDGWTIVDSIVEKLDFHHLHGTHVLVPKEPNEDMIVNALAVIATGVSKRSIDDEIRMLWAKMLEAAQESVV